MSDDAARQDNALVRILSRHLDFDMWNNWESITHKKIGDNLRCYPVIVLFAVAIPYLWAFPGKAQWVTKIAAITWTAWLGWYSILTLVQTYSLFTALIPEVVGRPARASTSLTGAVLKLLLMLTLSSASGFFMIGAGYMAWLIYSRAPH